MNPLRILYVDTDLEWRGGQEQVFSLMLGMRNRGHKVELAAPGRCALFSRASKEGVPAHPFRQRNELSPLSVLRLHRILRLRPFDIVHFNTPRPIVAGSLASWLRKVPVCVSSRRVNFPLRSLLSRFKYNWMLDCVITVSLSIRQTLVEGGIREEKVRVIYEGADLDWIDRQEPCPPLVDEGRVVVGIVAHLSPEKGHALLLEAAAQLAPRVSPLKVVIVGDGSLRRQLEDQVRRRGLQQVVLFTGFRSDSEAMMRQFDVFCLPSLSEGLSSAILAAMAGSLPVVATSVGGIPELVVDGETGLLVPPGDADALAEALEHLLRSKSLRRRMGEAGRRRVEEKFTLHLKLDRTEQLYRTLLQRAPSNTLDDFRRR